MIKFYIFLFFIFIEFIFLFFFKLSVFFLIFQSIIFNLFFLSLLINTSDTKIDLNLRNLRNIKEFFLAMLSSFYLEFVLSYIFYETIFSLIFSISYFFNFNVGFIILCFFKQGTFPFFFYNYVFNNIMFELEYLVTKDFIFIFLIISKTWALILYGKVIFCLSFYSFCFTVNLFMVFLYFSEDILVFLSIGVTLGNSVLGALCQMNNITCMFFYFIMMIIFYEICWNWLVSNLKLIGEDPKIFYFLLIVVSNAIPVTFFISIKFIFILVLGSYSTFSIISYFIISLVLLVYSGMMFSFLRGSSDFVEKLNYFHLLIFILFLIFLSFIF